MSLPRIHMRLRSLFSRLRGPALPIRFPTHHSSISPFIGAVFRSLVFAHLFITYIGSVSVTHGISMMPTLSLNSPWILKSRLHRRGRNIKVGDLITFDMPNKPHMKACKRVIGMPGDYVSVMTAGREEENVHQSDDEGDWANVKAESFRVPEGHCWVQGDNLEWSNDSRIFGPLPLALVDSKVMGIMMPFAEKRWFRSGLEDAHDEKKGSIVLQRQ